ncbi:MAG: hypothetical protein ACLT38_06750 [Akkermansia sp.]
MDWAQGSAELSANLTGRASWVNCGCRLSSFWATGHRSRPGTRRHTRRRVPRKRAREGATGVQVGAGITIPVGYTGSVFADVNADFRSRATSFNGSIGYRLTF